MRPFSGRLCTSACDDRAGDLAARRLEHGRLAADGDGWRRRLRRVSVTGSSNAEPTVSVSVRVTSANPARRTVRSVRADLQIGEPEASFAIGRRFGGDVGVGLARGDRRPGDDAALSSVTRPLTLAWLMVSWAAVVRAPASSAHPAKSAMPACSQ